MTTMIFSIDSSNRLTKLSTLRYPSDCDDVEHERRRQDRRRAGSSSSVGGPSHASPAIPPIAVWRSVRCSLPSAEALVDDQVEDDRAPRISAPRIASRQNSLTWGTRTRLRSRISIRIAPRKAPITVPEPPWMLTPPTTAAAIAASSKHGTGRDVHGAELSEEHEAGQPGQRAAHDERDERDPCLRQPGLAGRIRVGADGVQHPTAAQSRRGRVAARSRRRGRSTNIVRRSKSPQPPSEFRGRSTTQSGRSA